MSPTAPDKESSSSRIGIISAVKTPLGFFTLVLLALEVILGIILLKLGPGDHQTYLIFGIYILMFILIVVVTFLARNKPSELERDPSQPSPKSVNILLENCETVASSGLFSNSDDEQFFKTFKSLAVNARKIVLIGTGLNIIDHHKHDLSRLLDITLSNCQWEIYVGNPYSPAVEGRLIEEGTGNMPPTAREKLIHRLNSLLEKKRDLKDSKNLIIKLFSHYPTISLFIIDHHYFYYPYGFQTLGDFSPVTYYLKPNSSENENPMIRFLDNQYNLVRDSAVDAEPLFKINEKQINSEQDRNSIQKKLIPFAVYIIPSEDSPIYQFGSKLLGYDIRRQSRRASAEALDTYLGTTSSFGFHLTIADAIYFLHEYEIKVIKKEIESLLKEFRPFDLPFKIQEGFPDDRSISLTCSDEEGQLEILHFELVYRCYRRAVASNYSDIFGEKKAERNRNYADYPARSEKMINRYRAPYILRYFWPHFSLMTNVPEEKTKLVTQELAKELQKYPKMIKVKTLCLMTKEEGDYWKIKEELPLG